MAFEPDGRPPRSAQDDRWLWVAGPGLEKREAWGTRAGERRGRATEVPIGHHGVNFNRESDVVGWAARPSVFSALVVKLSLHLGGFDEVLSGATSLLFPRFEPRRITTSQYRSLLCHGDNQERRCYCHSHCLGRGSDAGVREQKDADSGGCLRT